MVVRAENARIWGSDQDSVRFAPIGTTLPTDLDGQLDPAFDDVGWLHSDGVTETQSGSKTVIRGHQGAGVVRTRMEETGTTFGFTALETKELTNRLRYDVQETSTAAGVRTEKRGAGQRVTALACVIDFYDADDVTVRERLVFERVEVTPNGEKVYAGNDIAGYPFEAEVIGGYTSISSDTDSPVTGD